MGITTVIFILVAVQSIFYTDGQEITFFRKDYAYIDATKGFYKIYTTPKTWLEAKKQCWLEGATLFYPENENEAKEVISFRKRTQPQLDAISIGISDLLEEGAFETIDGRPIAEVYNKWEVNEPNDENGNEDCVTIMNNDLLNDVPCNLEYPFICKKALKDLQRNEDMPSIAKLTAKIADLEKELANRTAVVEVMEREAQLTKIQTAIQTARLKDLEREVNQAKQPTCCNGLDRIAEAVANHAAASERISKAAGENQAAALERISKAIDNQAAVLEKNSKSVEKQAAAMEISSKDGENLTAALQRLIETMQRQAFYQSVAMERQALALEALVRNKRQ